MAMVTLGAFVGGLAAGWMARGLSDAPRAEVVRGVARGYHLEDALRRWVAARREWIEDLVAEGRAQYEASLRGAPAVQSADETSEEARVA